MLRIERSVEGGEVRLVLSGGIQGETLAKLERTIASETVVPVAISIDLAEVRLVDREAVRFLVECEAGGIRLANCPSYVREWIGTADAIRRPTLSDPQRHSEEPVTDGTASNFSRREMLQLAGGALSSLALGGALPDSLVAQAPPAPAVTDVVTVGLTINGMERRLELDPRTSLLDALREHLGLTGTKKGCNQGACGACTVLIDGKRMLSCLTLAPMYDGASVTTVEGLAQGDRLHPLQAAFIEHDGLQCGYCTPGQIMSGLGCIAEGHAGSEEEIRYWMSGNICRCGAYPGVVAAIADAARTGDT